MAVMNSDALMISLEDGTVQKVYSLEEEEVMVMVAVVVVVVVMMIFSLTLCLKKKTWELFFSLWKKQRLTVTQNRWTKLCVFGTLF
jgi:hypothetical protein